MALMHVGISKRAFENDKYCGDQCGHWHNGGKTTLCIIDGLGHGKYAEKVAKTALNYVSSHLSEPLLDIFSGCDNELHGTRGVVMGIAVIDDEKRTLTYAGIGNTRAVIAGEKKFQLSGNYGIVGGGYRILEPETLPFNPGNLVIMFTDGIVELIDILGYDDDLLRDVQRLSDRIIRDWSRGIDDAAVLVYKKDAK